MRHSACRRQRRAVSVAGGRTAERGVDAGQPRPLVRSLPRDLQALGVILLAHFAPVPAAGQDSALVTADARVRYWLPEISKPVEAVVVSRIADRIRVRPAESDDTLEFALSALSRLEVRRGPEPQGAAGAALGLFGGAVIGSFRFQHGSSSSSTYQGDVLRAYVFAVACAGIGWLIGSRVHRYRWQSVPLVPDTSSRGDAVLLAPQIHGASLRR